MVVDLQKGSQEESIIRWLLTCSMDEKGGTLFCVLVLTTVSQTTLTLTHRGLFQLCGAVKGRVGKLLVLEQGDG